jgi:hypothetical protein
VKSAEEIMNMLDGFDLTGSLRDAGELAGVSHHTVARYVAARDFGVADRGVTRPMLIDQFLPKVEEWVDRSNGKVRADAAHDKLVAVGFAGSERTTRRAVAAVKKDYRLGRVRVHRPWVTARRRQLGTPPSPTLCLAPDQASTPRRWTAAG